MKISEIQKKDVIDFIRLEEGTYSDNTLTAVMAAAKAYILEQTGLTEQEADTKDDLYIAYMVLCQDMHDNRAMYVDKDNVNKVVDSILYMHSKNLL